MECGHSQSHVAPRARLSSAVLHKWPEISFAAIMVGWVISILRCPQAFWDTVILALFALACIVYAKDPER